MCTDFVIEKIQIREIPERKLTGVWEIERPQKPILQDWYNTHILDKRLPRNLKKRLKKQFKAGSYSFLKDFGFAQTFHSMEAEEELRIRRG